MGQGKKNIEMTQKQKANELVEKFLNTQFHTEEMYDAKQCALICVDRQKTQLDNIVNSWDLEHSYWYKEELKKIEELKQEIEKL